MKVKVPVLGTIGKAVAIEADAPSRAEMNLAIAAAIASIAPAEPAPSLPVTLWRLIREVPRPSYSVLGVPGTALPQNPVAIASSGTLGETLVVQDSGGPRLVWTDSPTWTNNHRWLDSDEVQLGTDADLRLFHSGTSGTITNATGTLAVHSDATLALTSTGNFSTAAGGTTQINSTGAASITSLSTLSLSGTDVRVTSGPFLIQDGTVGAPGAAFLNDTDSGLYRIGTNNIGLTLGGSLFWNFNGNTTTFLGNDLTISSPGQGRFRTRSTGASPFFSLEDLSQAVDNRVWLLINSATNLNLSAYADDLTGPHTAFNFQRSGTTVTVVALGNTTDNTAVRVPDSGLSFLADTNTGIRRSATDTVTLVAGGTDVLLASSTTVDLGTSIPLRYSSPSVTQTNAAIRGRGSANSLEWGHSNAAGFASTLGFGSSNGRPFVAFNAEAGTNANTFRTRGVVGRILQSDAAGGLLIGRAATASADNQTLTVDLTVNTSGQLLLSDGTAGAPGAAFANDVDCGLYRVTTNEIALATAATERLRFNASGAFGLAGANYGTSGQVLTSGGSAAAPTWASPAVGANPTATIGLTAVNGSATSFLRSDGAPALSQAIVPTWTGIHTFNAAARFSDGTAGAPGVSFSGDTDCGLYRVTTNEIALATAAAERLRFNASGAFGLAGANYGTSGQVLTSGGSGAAPTWTTPASGSAGTYTPTVTNVANTSSSTAGVCQYLRVGDTVTVSGSISGSVTATGTTQIRITLPVASNLTANSNLGGAGVSASVEPILLSPDTTNDQALFTWSTTGPAPYTVYFSFTYVVQ